MDLKRSSGDLRIGACTASGASGGGSVLLIVVIVLAWRSFPERRRVSFAMVVGRHDVKGVSFFVVFVIALNIEHTFNIVSICVI